MADIEKEKFRQIGIGLINEYRQQSGFGPINWLAINTPEASAFIRSIQLHEKTKEELQGVKQEFDDFKQKVSDVLEKQARDVQIQCVCHRITKVSFNTLEQFIIPKPKPDPLINVAKMLGYYNTAAKDLAGDIRATLDAAGFEIREKNDG